jgi:hypothetical protein
MQQFILADPQPDTKIRVLNQNLWGQMWGLKINKSPNLLFYFNKLDGGGGPVRQIGSSIRRVLSDKSAQASEA